MLKRFATAAVLALTLASQLASAAPALAAPRPARLRAEASVEAPINDTEYIEDTVRAIVVAQLGVNASDVTVDARFREDLDANSLDLVELIMQFEEAFGGEISDEDAQKITTVGEAVTYISNHF